jgi:glycosyltransferase involved in cell wall biosynthesis
VLIEAMASGCYPMGTYFAGMGANIDIAASALDPQQGQYMRLSRDPEHLVENIAANVVGALGLNGSYRSALREVAVANYDWERIAQDLSRTLHTMGGAALHNRPLPATSTGITRLDGEPEPVSMPKNWKAS